MLKPTNKVNNFKKFVVIYMIGKVVCNDFKYLMYCGYHYDQRYILEYVLCWAWSESRLSCIHT